MGVAWIVYMEVYTDLENRVLTTTYTVGYTRYLGVFVITISGIYVHVMHIIYYRG